MKRDENGNIVSIELSDIRSDALQRLIVTPTPKSASKAVARKELNRRSAGTN
ncbi:hypothetical protein [Mycobacterium marinum]|uniref:hypothetical protein n=1 Tax=Mycobacterium marinum TaxID=1781 RepID=UPI0035616754